MKHTSPSWLRLRRAALAAVAAGMAAVTGSAAGPAPPPFFSPIYAEGPGEQVYELRQGPASVRFATRSVAFHNGEAALSMEFQGTAPAVRIEAGARLPGIVNRLLGSSPGGWRTNLPTYSSVVYRGLYPGVDLVYEVNGGELKSEFRLAAGVAPEVIRWRYRGAEAVSVDRDGSLVVAAAGGRLREQAPVVFQDGDGGPLKVEGRFQVHADGSAGFTIGGYDAGRPLVIDPVLLFSTYLGGSGLDTARAIATDAAGSAYVAGYTDSADFPLAGALQTAIKGSADAFVAKLSADGSALVYCTYLGGSYDDRAFGIAVDAPGNAYLTGWTYSTNFPVTSGARQRALGGGRDAFVAKLNAAGSALVYSTYLGGSGNDSGNALAVDALGNAYVAGDTYSTNLPVSGGVQSANAGRQDAFAAKLNAAGSALVWSSYLGGTGDDTATALAIDASGNAYLAGATSSTNFPTASPLQAANAGGSDAFVAKINATGSSLGFSTYLGGSGGTVAAPETATGIGLDGSGNVYVAGYTSATNFPVLNAYQSAHKGGTLDGFLVKLNSSGAAMAYGTYFGGSGLDYINALAVDASGMAVVAGYTASSNLPAVNPAQTAKAGGYDAFLARFNASGATLDFSSYLGGADLDAANAVAIDATRSLWVAGQTASAAFPTKNPIQALNPGGYAGFVAKFGDRTPTAAFRATNGNTILMRYGTTTLYNAAGNVTSAVGASQNPAGDTYVVGRNDSTCVYVNTFLAATRGWAGWIRAGCGVYGDPAVAAGPGGAVTVVARDASYNYYLAYYTPASGFGAWVPLGGGFASEPAIAAAANGTVYVVGRNSGGVVSGGRYVPGSGFLGWSQAPATVTAVGKPAVAAGADGAAYVAIRALTTNNTWMARMAGNTWGAWMNGGGQAKTDPEVAAGGGLIYAAVTNLYSTVYVQAFTEGSGNNWQGWQSLNGVLNNGSVAAANGAYYVAGRTGTGTLYWYQSGIGWTYAGAPGVAASEPAASPK